MFGEVRPQVPLRAEFLVTVTANELPNVVVTRVDVTLEAVGRAEYPFAFVVWANFLHRLLIYFNRSRFIITVKHRV